MFKSYLSSLICPYCGSVFELDDIDYNFPGNQDEYFICSCCHSSAFVKIRYGKVCKIEYTESVY